MNLLTVDKVTIGYGELLVVFDAGINVNKGEVVFLVGRNGAGKTTLLRCISGFIKSSSGNIVFNGEDINNCSSYNIAKKGLKYINQEKRVFSDLTVRENFELSSYATKDYDWETILKYFPKLKILFSRKAGNLSGGEKQMLLMAIALIGKPELILMDEPTEGLSPQIILDLSETFKKVSKITTLLIVEQNIPLITDIGDRVYCMQEGKILQRSFDKNEIKEFAFEKYL